MKRNINIIASTAVPLDIENVDTDQIIPARFLKATSREGFGKNLFRDWRYENDDETKPRKDFILNNSLYKGSILVAGKNFGCGSSREHAAWALKDAGFDVVISSFFADIFKTNALNNFLLPVQVSEKFSEHLLSSVFHYPDTIVEVNLEEQTVSLLSGEIERFPINSYKKTCLLKGYDDIDYLLSLKDKVESFEKNYNNQFV